MFCFDMVCLSRPYHFKFFKGCLPQLSHGPFLNTLSHLSIFIHQLNLSQINPLVFVIFFDNNRFLHSCYLQINSYIVLIPLEVFFGVENYYPLLLGRVATVTRIFWKKLIDAFNQINLFTPRQIKWRWNNYKECIWKLLL